MFPTIHYLYQRCVGRYGKDSCNTGGSQTMWNTTIAIDATQGPTVTALKLDIVYRMDCKGCYACQMANFTKSHAQPGDGRRLL